MIIRCVTPQIDDRDTAALLIRDLESHLVVVRVDFRLDSVRGLQTHHLG